jgi:hypothetical protein
MSIKLFKSNEKFIKFIKSWDEFDNKMNAVIKSCFHIVLEVSEIFMYIFLAVGSLCLFYVIVNHYNNPNFLPKLNLVTLSNSIPNLLLFSFTTLVGIKILRKHF